MNAKGGPGAMGDAVQRWIVIAPSLLLFIVERLRVVHLHQARPTEGDDMW